MKTFPGNFQSKAKDANTFVDLSTNPHFQTKYWNQLTFNKFRRAADNIMLFCHVLGKLFQCNVMWSICCDCQKRKSRPN